MRPVTRLRRGLVAGALLTGAIALPAPAAQASPVFSGAYIDVGSQSNRPPGCTVVETKSPPIEGRPAAENGTPVTGSSELTGTITRNNDGTDVTSYSTQIAGSASVTSVDSNPSTMDLVANGSVAATATKPVSACGLSAMSTIDLYARLTVAEAGFLTITTTSSAHAAGLFFVSAKGKAVFGLSGEGTQFGGVNTVFLQAGDYDIDVGATALVKGAFQGSRSRTVRAARTIPSTAFRLSFHAEFAVAGSRTAASAGKATRYVDLPATRSCETDALLPTVTAKRQRARKVRQIKVFVNDQLVKKVTTPRRRQVIRAPVPDEAAADIRAEVTLRSPKPGRPGRSYEATASYAPCS